MSTTGHVTRNDLRWWATSIVIPGVGLLLTVVIGGTKALDKMDMIGDKLEKVSERQDRQDEKINHISAKVDTVERRQAIYQATHR